MIPSALLDTDTLSQVIKGQNVIAATRATDYLIQLGYFTFSLMPRYEILRGLKAKNALVQLTAFEEQCRASSVLPITDEIIVRASGLYADLKRRGALISDADLIIAATALEHGLTLVTSNTAHFSRIAGLPLDCWTTP